jgi:hypothetical protein
MVSLARAPSARAALRGAPPPIAVLPTPIAAAVVALALAAAWTPAAHAAGPPVVACSAEPPTVAPGGTALLQAWAASSPGRAIRYEWEAPVGRVESAGRQARWDLTGLRPGTYAAAVQARDGAGAKTECVVRVIVRQDTGSRGPGVSPAPARETGSALLAAGARESEGYGLYSYLLLGAPPTAATRERQLRAIDAFWSVVPAIRALEQYVPKAELNVAYVPVTSASGAGVSAEWILEHYDHARARSLLRFLSGVNRDGPYLISTLRPLNAAATEQLLFQDLSSVPPHLAASWVKEFLNQAAQERFWDQRSGARLALKLRVTVGILGEGLPEVKKALDGWISWGR